MSNKSEKLANASQTALTEDELLEHLELKGLINDDRSASESQCEKYSPKTPHSTSNEEDQPDGVLTERLLDEMDCLSNLNKTADGSSYAFLEMTAASLRLHNIDLLANYEQLQVLNVSHNNLESLAAIGSLRHLIGLDASNNLLTEAFDFKTLPNLRRVDLSRNRIVSIPDLRAYKRLDELDLSYNDIADVSEGLLGCSSLRHLRLGNNRLRRLQNLDGLPLVSLGVERNELVRPEGLDSLRRLQRLSLAGNRLVTLAGLEAHPMLQEIDAEDNQLLEIFELRHLKDLRLLRKLSLLNNPMQKSPDYRLLVIFNLPRLTHLDNVKVDVKEKVCAENQENPSMEIVAQRDHRLNMVYSYFQPHTVMDSTLQSSDTPYPMLVLVGPNGSMKKDLALKLVNDFPEYFGYGTSTTTRPAYPDEDASRDYSFVTPAEFEELQVNGRFVQTSLFQGHYFGLTIDAVESVAREGLACVVHMELEGVLALKKTHFEPRYVLTMPLDQHRHDRHLRSRQQRQERDIRDSLKRAQLYLQYNQQHPGFFDMFICTDEPQEAYRQLKMLVMNYLGLNGDSQAAGPDAQDDAAPSGRTLNRTWSKTSQQSSVFNPVRPSATQTSGKGEVEEESLKRRRSAAKGLVSAGRPVGKAPNTSETGERGEVNRLELSSADEGNLRSSVPKAPRSRSRAGVEPLAGATTYSPAAVGTA